MHAVETNTCSHSIREGLSPLHTQVHAFSGINEDARLLNSQGEGLDKAVSGEVSPCGSWHFADHEIKSPFSRVAWLVVSANKFRTSSPVPMQTFMFLWESTSTSPCTSDISVWAGRLQKKTWFPSSLEQCWPASKLRPLKKKSAEVV